MSAISFDFQGEEIIVQALPEAVELINQILLKNEKKDEAEWELMIEGLPHLYEVGMLEFCEKMLMTANFEWQEIDEVDDDVIEWYGIENSPLDVSFIIVENKKIVTLSVLDSENPV